MKPQRYVVADRKPVSQRVSMSDRVTLSARKINADGHLVVTATLARIGTQDYLRGEMGLDGNPFEVVRVDRPASEVFDQAALDSFKSKPVTDDHPGVDVTPDNVNTYAVGLSGDDIARDGRFVRGTLTITNKDVIAKIESGKVEVSLGYSLDLEFRQGINADGKAFDAVQRNIRGNHIAIVDAGRCGGECRLDDANGVKDCDCASCKPLPTETKETIMSDKPKTVNIDGVPVDSLDEAVEIINRKQTQLDDIKNSVRQLRDDMFKLEKRYTDELNAKDELIAKERAKTSDEAVSKLMSERHSILMRAADFLPDDYEEYGKPIGKIARDACAAVYGPARVEGKSDEYCLAVFDTLDMEVEGDATIGKAITSKRQNRDSVQASRNEYAKTIQDAWRSGGAA